MLHLTVTLESWVTPHVMTALVPLMTLWSCGGLVMRVRAADTHRHTAGCYSETQDRIGQSALYLLASFTEMHTFTAVLKCLMQLAR